jgi:hypothetical protein
MAESESIYAGSVSSEAPSPLTPVSSEGMGMPTATSQQQTTFYSHHTNVNNLPARVLPDRCGQNQIALQQPRDQRDDDPGWLQKRGSGNRYESPHRAASENVSATSSGVDEHPPRIGRSASPSILTKETSRLGYSLSFPRWDDEDSQVDDEFDPNNVRHLLRWPHHLYVELFHYFS